LNLWLPHLQLFSNRHAKALTSEEIRDFKVVVSLSEPVRTVALDRQFPSKRERDQHEQQEKGKEPPKRGGIAHVSHLAR
jgi:hypothetical protein